MLAAKKVTPRWRMSAYGIASVLMSCMAAYLVVKGVRIMRQDVVLELAREPHFGNLPNFKFTVLPYGHSETTYGYYKLLLENGMELQPPEIARKLKFTTRPGISTNKGQRSFSLENIGVMVENETISFNTSQLVLPHFSHINRVYNSSLPQPKISFEVLFRSKAIGHILKGFYMLVEDPLSGRKAYFGGLTPTEQTAAEGYSHGYVFSCSKQVHKYIATEDTLSGKYLARMFQKQQYSFRVRSMYDFISEGCECADTYIPIHLEGKTGAGKGSGVPSNDTKVACRDDWRVLHVIINFREEAVSVYKWKGRPLQMLDLLSSCGGLWTICTGLFFLCYTRKNTTSRIYLTYEELTFAGEPFLKPSDNVEDAEHTDDSSTEMSAKP